MSDSEDEDDISLASSESESDDASEGSFESVKKAPPSKKPISAVPAATKKRPVESVAKDSGAGAVAASKKKKTEEPPRKGVAGVAGASSSVAAASRPPPATSSSSSSSSSTAAPSVAAASSSSGMEDITRGAEITTEPAAKKLILKYLRQQNRPYSLIQIYDNLHKRIAKPVLERCLTVLSEGKGETGGLLCKEYGKAKIYFPDQATMMSTFSDSDMHRLQADTAAAKGAAEALQQEERRLRAVLADSKKEPDDIDLDRVLAESEARVDAKRGRLLSATACPVDPAAVSKLLTSHNNSRNQWRQRKLMCVEAVELLAEGMEKSVKTVMADLGIETDADVGEELPPLIVQKK